MIIADTSGLLALFDRSERRHADVVAAVEKHDGPIVVSPFVVAELDYLVATRIGVDAERAVLAELSGGAYDLAGFSSDDLVAANDVIGRYADQQIGLADASNVVLARRYGTNRLLTLDHRHFAVLRPIGGGRFTLAP